MKSKTVIEVNGKRYDAITGAAVGVASASSVTSGHNIDGFFRSRPAPAKPQTSPAIQQIQIAATADPTPRKRASRTINHTRAHSPQTAANTRLHVRVAAPASQTANVQQHSAVQAKHVRHHAAQSSQTLMRTVVQRPLPSFHKQAGTQASLQHKVPSLIVPKASVASVNPARLLRAQAIHRSPQITRHGHQSGVHATLAPLAVQPQPDPTPVVPPPQPNNDGVPAAPAPQPNNGPEKPTDIFEHALMNAGHFVDVHTHVNHFKKQTRRHLTSMAAGTIALVVIAGFAAYQNTPGLQFKVASIQAGVSTGMPNFKAAGFAYNGVKASGGKLTVGFAGKNGQYQLTQQTTNLSGTDVIQNVGATDAGGHPNYTTVQAGNTTIYRFATTDAMWVSNGMWYTVNGNAPLSDQQVQSLVKNV